MQLLQKSWGFTTDAWGSLTRAGDTFRWIWYELLPTAGRRHSFIALGLMFIGMLISMQVINLLNGLISTVGQGNLQHAEQLIVWIAVSWVVGRLVLGWQNSHREWAWNRNTVHIPVRLTELQFRKTHGELKCAHNGVSPEQIESAKDKISNIQYAVLFEGSEAFAILASSFIFICFNDWVLGLIVTALIIINGLFFLFANHYFSNKIEQIDKDWRHAQAWTSERWVQFSLVKVTGMEQFVRNTINTKLKKALDPDFMLWGVEFQIVDLVRSLMNIGILVGSLWYGLHAEWELGLYAGMFLWLNAVKDQLWRIGSIQRHLVENTERIQKIRVALTQKENFHFDEGEEYRPEGDTTYAV